MKRCVFSFDLKISKDDAFLISNGNSFHSLGVCTCKQMLDLLSVLALFLFYVMMGSAVIEYLGKFFEALIS